MEKEYSTGPWITFDFNNELTLPGVSMAVGGIVDDIVCADGEL